MEEGAKAVFVRCFRKRGGSYFQIRMKLLFLHGF